MTTLSLQVAFLASVLSNLLKNNVKNEFLASASEAFEIYCENGAWGKAQNRMGRVMTAVHAKRSTMSA